MNHLSPAELYYPTTVLDNADVFMFPWIVEIYKQYGDSSKNLTLLRIMVLLVKWFYQLFENK